jgi:hypothetical protein
MILWWAGVNGPRAIPGNYKAKLSIGERVLEQNFRILPDPRAAASQEDYLAQFNFMKEVQAKVSEAHQAIIDIRDLRSQLQGFVDRLDAKSQTEVVDTAKAIMKRMASVEETLYQTKNRSGQDPLNYPIRLTNKLAHLNALTSVGNFRPTAAALTVKAEMEAAIDAELNRWKQIKSVDIPALNALIRQKALDVIVPK